MRSWIFGSKGAKEEDINPTDVDTASVGDPKSNDVPEVAEPSTR